MLHTSVHELPLPRPYDLAGLLAWFAPRAVTGVEVVTDRSYARTLSLPGGPAAVTVRPGVRRDTLDVEVRCSVPEDAREALRTVKHLFDTATDSSEVDAALARHPVLAPLVAAAPGMRLPGSAGLPEALLRALVGQQITVAQARGLLGAAAEHGARVETGTEGLWRTMPEPAVVAATVDEWFRGPGARRRAIAGAMEAVTGLAPATARDAPTLRAWLLALPGVGPWTADYVVMRALRHPDTVPSPDVALRAGARRVGLGTDYRDILAALEPLRPWRSYAALHLWRAAA